MRVLYLEDHASDADLMVRTLARHMPQAEVTLASDVAGARSLLANDPHFDLALLDMRLPDGDGFEILSEIRSRSLPIATVMLTGVGDEHSAVRALKLRADDYLVKSGNYLEQLPNVFHYALERCRRDGERRLPMLRVLYAEHNRDDVELTRLHFQRQAPHIQLHIVSGAQGVLDWAVDADRTEVHVLLLDYRLIGMDALELIKTLRRDHALDLPIVLVTGRGSEEAAAAALRLGVSDYLIKQPGYLEKLPLVLEHAYAHDALLRERARLYHLATYDELTGLFNRTEFCARAEQALRHDNRLGKRCALMLVDLDDFKAINDTYGHGAGDQLLRAVAGRLHDTLREDDICGRFGGDEFLILLESVDESDQVARTATRIADALLERFSRPL